MLYILVNLLLTPAPTAAGEGPPSALRDADLRDLSLLPLDKLLAVKRALSYSMSTSAGYTQNARVAGAFCRENLKMFLF